MKGTFPIDKFQEIQTPFYYYDTNVLRQTLKTINEEAGKHEGFEVHYAVKANANPKVLNIICQAGLGADCVSGGEIQAAIKAGFPASKIVYAGVGKSDWEINLGLEKGIFCFNVESIPELEIINELAEKQNKIAQVCFRINPDVGAHTHANITTGLAENKFGIAMRDMEAVIEEAAKMKNIQFLGLHFFSPVDKMALLEMRRMISDEGIGGFLKIVFNVLRNPAARKRILAMRAAFKSHEDYLCAVGLVAVKPE